VKGGAGGVSTKGACRRGKLPAEKKGGSFVSVVGVTQRVHLSTTWGKKGVKEGEKRRENRVPHPALRLRDRKGGKKAILASPKWQKKGGTALCLIEWGEINPVKKRDDHITRKGGGRPLFVIKREGLPKGGRKVVCGRSSYVKMPSRPKGKKKERGPGKKGRKRRGGKTFALPV